jgi:DNA-binding transcriptional LysR family regulator
VVPDVSEIEMGSRYLGAIGSNGPRLPDLNSLPIFAKIAQANSFSEAARRLNLPISTVSRRLAEQENELGVRLIEPSTGHLRVTEIGAEILEHAHRSAELGDAIVNIVSNQLSDVAGLLRIAAPPGIADTLLAQLVTALQNSYPNVRIVLLVSARRLDPISEGVDLAFWFGRLRDCSLVARKILTYRHRLTASLTYLAAAGPPQMPQDLLRHFSIAAGDHVELRSQEPDRRGSPDVSAAHGNQRLCRHCLGIARGRRHRGTAAFAATGSRGRHRARRSHAGLAVSRL